MSDTPIQILPPEWLEPEVSAIFEDTVQLMGKAATPQDMSLIADFSQAQHDVQRLTHRVKMEGEIIRNEKGMPCLNPATTLLISRRNALERLRHDLKITPRARQALLTGGNHKPTLKDRLNAQS